MFIYAKTNDDRFDVFKIDSEGTRFINTFSASDLKVAKKILQDDIMSVEIYKTGLQEKHKKLLNCRTKEDYSDSFCKFWLSIQNDYNECTEQNIRILAYYNRYW